MFKKNVSHVQGMSKSDVLHVFDAVKKDVRLIKDSE